MGQSPYSWDFECRMGVGVNRIVLTMHAGHATSDKAPSYEPNASQSYLHGLPSHHTDATPTCGLFFIAFRSGTPAAYNMALSWSVTFIHLPSVREVPSLIDRQNSSGESLREHS